MPFAIDFGSPPVRPCSRRCGFFMRNILALPVSLSLCACAPVATQLALAGTPHYIDADRRACILMQDEKHRDVPLCLSESWGAGGAHGQVFGPLEIDSMTDQYRFIAWAAAGMDGWRGSTMVVNCTSDARQHESPSLDNLMPVEFRRPLRHGNRVILEFGYEFVAAAMHEKACARLKSGSFTAEELEGRDVFHLQGDDVELRADEYQLRTVWVYFDWPSPMPHLQLTPP